MPTKMRQSEAAFIPRWVTPNLVNSLKREHAPDLVDAVLTRIDGAQLEAVVNGLLNSLIYGGLPPYALDFLEADLARRKSQARMVEEEAGMFSEIRSLLQTANARYAATPTRTAGAPNRAGAGDAPATTTDSAASDVSGPIDAVANLVQALAKKNETMREGHPGTPPPPGKPGGQSDGPPHTKEKKPDCYEKYKARIVELWNQKEAMGDDLLWGLYWLDALKDLTLCAGPAAVKLLLDLLKAGKGK